MLNDRERYGPVSYIAAGMVLAACMPSFRASAQTTDASVPTSTMDGYNNVRPTFSARRSVGLFQNEQQREALRGYQDMGRNRDRRGGFSPFSLPGDRNAGIGARLAPGMAGPQPGGSLSAFQRRAFSQYGGFGQRPGRARPGQIATALSRRQTLIAATALNAPVYRAFLRDISGGVRRTVERTPFVRREESEPADPPSRLDEWLRTSADLAHLQIREKAWAWFRGGRYQRAARAFESASTLEPSDAESRIGELFCHLALRARRTSLAVFAELTSRDDNVFLHKLTEAKVRDLTGVFGDAEALRQVRAAAQLGAESGDQDSDVRALSTLALWYLGKHYAAAQAAAELARSSPDTAYADWPAKIEAAEKAVASEP